MFTLNHSRTYAKETSTALILKTLIFLSMTAVLFLMTGCAKTEQKTITIADQFGLAYAPLTIMKDLGYLDAKFESEDVAIVWEKYGNTTAIREAMLSGSLDVGFVGIPPFLLGRDNGMDWRIFSGLSESAVALMTKDDGVQSLNDLTDAHRIIMPQLGSIQDVLLKMALEKNNIEVSKFDHQIVALSHPDGVALFQSGDRNDLHFTTPPYIDKDLEVAQARILLDGEACFGGEFTFIVGMCREAFYENQPLYLAFNQALDESIAYINEQPEASAEILARYYDYSSDQILAMIQNGDLSYSSEVKGLETFQTFMVEIGLLKEVRPTENLIWE